MTTPIQKFKTQLQLTIADIKTHLPYDRDFELHEFKISTAMTINPRESIKWFMEILEPFAEQIITGNDKFFMNTDFKEKDMDENYFTIFTKIKSVWLSLNETDRETIKRNFKLVLMLGTIAVQNENIRVIINKYRNPSNPLTW